MKRKSERLKEQGRWKKRVKAINKEYLYCGDLAKESDDEWKPVGHGRIQGMKMEVEGNRKRKPVKMAVSNKLGGKYRKEVTKNLCSLAD